MEIDVIIPTHNRAHTLTRAISSVFNQSYKQFQIYLIDDASSDESFEIIKPYLSDPRFHYHKLDVNVGVSEARNTGVQLGQSTYISFLDSDDEWHREKLQTQIEFMNENKECHFLHSEEIWIRNGVRVNPKLKHSKVSEDIFNRSLHHCLISPSTVLMKRQLFLDCGGFDPSMVVCEDYDLWLKILMIHEIGFIASPLINKYGGHADQLSHKFVAMDYWRIKALIKLLQNSKLNETQKINVLEMIKSKSKLLLLNFKKYGNMILAKEISDLLKNHKIDL